MGMSEKIMTSTTVANSVNGDNFECRKLEQLLRKHFGNDFTLVDYKTERLVPLGENFASIVIKIEAKARRTADSPVIEDFHFVGKMMVPGSAFHDKIDFGCLLNKEVFMYTDIIPTFAKVERECGIDEKETIVNLVPKMYGHRLSLDPNAIKADKDAIILMENLKVEGYYVSDKKLGLDLKHATYAIKALARFHALGVATRRKLPTDFEALKIQADKGIFDYDIMICLYDRFIDYMKREPRLAIYSDRVEPIIKHLYGTMRFEERTHELWSTILHHDFWTTNIIFLRDDTGRPDSVKFIDFQAYAFADLFVDLSYFFFTSIKDEVVEEHLDKLISDYYDTFEFTLRKLGVDVSEYSKKAFDERYRQVARYDLPRNILAFIFLTTTFDDVEDPKDISTNILAWKGNEQLIQKVLKLLQFFVDKDWL